MGIKSIDRAYTKYVKQCKTQGIEPKDYIDFIIYMESGK